MKYSKTEVNMHIKGYWNKNSSTNTKRMSGSYLLLAAIWALWYVVI